jgi:hypothetical protein
MQDGGEGEASFGERERKGSSGGALRRHASAAGNGVG